MSRAARRARRLAGAVVRRLPGPVGRPVRRLAARPAPAAPEAAEAAPVVDRAGYLATVATAPWALAPGAVGPTNDDDVVGRAADALRAAVLRGTDPMPVLRGCRERLLRDHPTPHELLAALVEAEAAAACLASRRTGAAGGRAPGGVVLVDERTPAPAVAGREDVLGLLREGPLPVRSLLPTGAGDGTTPAPVAGSGVAGLARLREPVSLWLGADTLGAHVAAAAVALADPGCVGVAVVDGLEDHLRPADAAVWLRTRARAALLPVHDLVLTADRCTAEDLVRFGGVARDRVVVVPGPPPVRPEASGEPSRPGDVVVLVGPEPGDDVPAVLHALHLLDRVPAGPAGHAEPAEPAEPAGPGPLRAVLAGRLPEAAAAVLPVVRQRLGSPAGGVVEVGGDLDPAGALVVVDTTVGTRHAARLRRAVAAGVPAVAVRSVESVALLGEGPWLVPPRHPEALLAALEQLRPAGREWAARQLEALRATVAQRERALSAALGQVVARATRPAETSSPRPEVALVLASYPDAALVDHLVDSVGDRLRGRGVTVRTWGVDAPTLGRELHRDVAELDASAFVRHPRPRALAVVTDRVDDAVVLEQARVFGATVLCPDTSLFHSHLRTRGPVGAAALFAGSDDPPTPHDLVVMAMGPDATPGTGMVDVSRDLARLVLTSAEAAHQVLAEGGRDAVSLPAVPAGPDLDLTDPDAAPLGGAAGDPAAALPGGPLVVGCLARARGRNREAERVVAAVGWLRAWGVPAEVLLPGWLGEGERASLRALARRRGVAGALSFVDGAGASAVEHLVEAADVVVHLGSGPETTTLEDLLAARSGAAVVTTASCGRAEEDPATVVQVLREATPLLLAEAVLVAAAAHAERDLPPAATHPRTLERGWVDALAGMVAP